jgi:hypothetical protein
VEALSTPRRQGRDRAVIRIIEIEGEPPDPEIARDFVPTAAPKR